MNLLTIPARYMRARWTHTLMLLLIFLLGVASMIALQEVSSTVAESYEKKLVSYGANILITPRRDTIKVSYGGYTLGDVTLEEHAISLDAALSAIEGSAYRANLAVIAPKLLTTTRIGSQTLAVVGVIWDEEESIKSYWRVDGDWPSAESALVGSRVAAGFGLGQGSSIEVAGRDIPVAGVLRETGSDDDNVIFVSLPLLQDLAGRPGAVDFLEVAALCSGCPIDDIVASLKTALPDQDVLALRQVAESRMYSVHFAQNLTFYVSLLILATACATLFMAMLSAVQERVKEIGIMRSVGFSRADIFMLFALESLLLGLAAGMAGFALGHQLSGYVLRNLHLVDAGVEMPFSWGFFVLTTVAVGAIATVAALFPAWKASRIEPTEALASM